LPVLDVVRALCGIVETDTPRAAADTVRGTLTEPGLDAEELAPNVLQLLGVKEGAQALDALSPEVINRLTNDALERTLLAAGRRPRRRVHASIAGGDLGWRRHCRGPPRRAGAHGLRARAVGCAGARVRVQPCADAGGRVREPADAAAPGATRVRRPRAGGAV